MAQAEAPPPGQSGDARDDELMNMARQDGATVAPDGSPLAATIEGVIVHQPPIHVDHRGALVEMFTRDDFWEHDFAYAYQTSIRPNTLKGWYAHEFKNDRYHLVRGELLLCLYDDRPDSPTRGLAQTLVLSERSARQVFIPNHVWHLSLNVGVDEAILVNLPTAKYNHAAPDRVHIPWDSPLIPVDVRSFLPVAFAGPQPTGSGPC
ncbi:MAG: hypothetical protein RLZ55_566 [Actinomycetota bacterium]|jgi:dTDP-4-dehydrorhamnose 3,5-epimerase